MNFSVVKIFLRLASPSITATVVVYVALASDVGEPTSLPRGPGWERMGPYSFWYLMGGLRRNDYRVWYPTFVNF